MRQLIFLCVVVVITIISVNCDTETPTEQCPGSSFDHLHERIHVEPCGKTRCKLRKGTNITVTIKFKPKNAVTTLTHRVNGEIHGVSLPFIGVTGKNACEHVTRADNGEPVSCPLAAGEEYVNVNVIPIENIYPQTDIRVHWALNDGKDDVMCFEMPAVITK